LCRSSRIYPCRTYPFLPVPCHAYSCLPCLVVLCLPVPICAYLCRVVRVCAYLCHVVLTRVVSSRVSCSCRAVLGPFNRVCHAVSKIKKSVTSRLRTRHVTRVVPARIGMCAVPCRSRAVSFRVVPCLDTRT
jgi:hypothetical protein